MKLRLFILFTFVIAAIAGAALWWLSRPGPLRLTRLTYAELPEWNASKPDAALAAFRRGCATLLKKPDATPLGGAGYGGTVADWRAVCSAQAGDARNFFQTRFTPFAVSAGPVGGGLFTGYYEPQIKGSRARHDAFQTPVYGVPPDLVRADLGLFIPRLKGEHISGRLDGHALVPYPARAEIEKGGIANLPPLFFTDDPVAFFFLQIQGSGRALVDDGTTMRVAYAGENGQPYTAIGRTLIRQGALTRANVSMQTIRDWLKAHPREAPAVMQTDKSFIFFQERPLGDARLGSPGSLGVALTPLASLAVDQRIHALGAPFYVAADGPDPVHAVMVAQDTGGAIRGPVRGDIFFGFGAQAENRAGNMKAPGQLYVLLPNALAAKIGESRDYPR